MKLDITGASNFVNRMFEACGPFQWAREFLKNAQEAGATRVEFGVEWQAVRKRGVYRRTIADNGSGMSRDEIVRFFSKLGEGAKPIGGVHDNFGVGAKIASLPWNPDGVIILSWKNGQGSMIWIRLDVDSGDYELGEFEDNQGRTVVIDPDVVDWTADDEDAIDWSHAKPDWIGDHGTVIVLLGSPDHADTVLGNPGAKESDLKGLSLYLNTRFWDLSATEVYVVEMSTAQKNLWPTDSDGPGDEGRCQRRRAQGALYYLTDVRGGSGRLGARGALRLDEERVLTEWYFWEGERPNIGPYAMRGGYIAIRYNGELFHVTTRKVEFRWFGIIESEVQHRTTIILEPRHLGHGTGRWGVHPDQSRNRLIFTGGGQSGVEVPLAEWGIEFAEVIPQPIRDAIMAARGDLSGGIEDDEYRKRLQEKFGDRWRTRRLVISQKKGVDPATEQEIVRDIYSDGLGTGSATRRGQQNESRGTMRVRRKPARPGGDSPGHIQEEPVDVPRFDFQKADAFEKPWHLAIWQPNDPEGPTVYINVESGILQDVVEYHQEQYPEIYHEEVAKIVRQVFGEVAACKVAHSQKLATEVPEQELDDKYRSEAALTVALMGLMAEESLISQRLGRLGKKRA